MKPSSTTWIAVGAALAVGALAAWNGSGSARAGEPLAVRWLRTAAVHPLRTWLALVLLLWALHPPPRAQPNPDTD